MKTNQEMVVNIGNSYRANQGLPKLSITEWLRKENVWEFIYEVELKYGNKFQSGDSPLCLSDYKNSKLCNITTLFSF